MSLGGEDLKKTEELPGAFPSEDAITKSAVTEQHTKPYSEHDLGAHQNVAQVGGANNSGVPSQGGQNIAHTTAAGAGSTASPADSDPDHLLHRAGAEGSVPSSASASRTAQHNDGLGPDNAPNITEDLKSVGSGAATAATAAAIAARDAALAVKDAAAPVVSAASEQVRQTDHCRARSCR